MTKKNENLIAIDPNHSDFGLILNCAVRYALGRRTYMPSAVIGFIQPILPKLDTKTLYCLDQDIASAKYEGGYGDSCDEKEWLTFHLAVRAERIKRGETPYVHWRDKEGAQ